MSFYKNNSWLVQSFPTKTLLQTGNESRSCLGQVWLKVAAVNEWYLLLPRQAPFVSYAFSFLGKLEKKSTVCCVMHLKGIRYYRESRWSEPRRLIMLWNEQYTLLEETWGRKTVRDVVRFDWIWNRSNWFQIMSISWVILSIFSWKSDL